MGMIQKRLIQAAGILLLMGLYSFALYQWGKTACKVSVAEQAQETAEENRKDAAQLLKIEQAQAPAKEKIITRFVTLTKEIESAPEDEKNSTLSPLLHSVLYQREPVQRKPGNGQ